MAEHDNADSQGTAQISAPEPPRAGSEQRPHEIESQAVGPRVVVEIHWIRLGEPGRDPRVFDAQEQEHRKQQIDERAGGDQPTEIYLGRNRLGGKAGSKMTDEHFKVGTVAER